MMWGFEVNNQIINSALSTGLGIVLCLYYDVLRVIRNLKRRKKLAAFCCDVFFFVTAAFVYFCFLQLFSNGINRFYIIAFCAVGFVFARLTVSKLFLKLLGFIQKSVVKIIRILSAVIKVVEQIFMLILKKVTKPLNKAVFFAKKLLKNNIKLVYNTTENVHKNFSAKRNSINGRKKIKKHNP